MTHPVLLQSQPKTVIVSARADDRLLTLLENQEWILEQRPTSDFRFSHAKQELLNLNVPRLANKTTAETLLQMDKNVISVGCAGCVVLFQARTQIGTIFDINQVSLVHLNTVMYIPKDTYWALSIFEKVQHANIQSASVVEGMSLFGSVR
jgi:DNA mismatch repair ATPase MutS